MVCAMVKETPGGYPGRRPELDMNAPATPIARPARIVLATDLSPGCDRALDRAAQLAAQWQLPLLVIHALPRDAVDSWPVGDDAPSWRQPPDTRATIERQVRRDLRHTVAQLTVHTAEGPPADVILEAANGGQDDLIVLGAGRERSGHHFLGKTAEALLRKSPASMLVVKDRPRRAYQRVLVGTDFTVESRHGLHVASSWFPHAEFTLMHALDIPYQSLWLDDARRQAYVRLELATIGDFLDDAGLPEALRQQIRPQVEHGHPEITLRNYVLKEGADLTVIGALRRGLTFHMLVGGTARRIVQAVPGDVLVVRADLGSAAG